jgi:hypothetical protein
VTSPTILLQRFITRYRTALLVKAAVLASLGLLLTGVLALRLRALHGSSPWSLAIPGLVLGVMGCGLGWWLRRHWLSGRRAAAFLDRELGLEQRLVTAEEFAAAAQPPPLYPLLVEDAARHCSSANPRFPRPVDRTAAPLALIVLLLLLWPRIDPVRFPARPQAPRTPTPRAPNDQVTPPPQRQDERQRQPPPAAQQQSSGAGAQGAGDSSAGQQRQQVPSAAGGAGSPQTPQGGSRGDEQNQSQQASAGQGSPSSESGAQGREQSASGAAQQGAQPRDAAQAGQAGRDQAEGRREQGDAQSGSSQADAARQGGRSGQRDGQQQASASQGGGQQAGGDRAQAASPGARASQEGAQHAQSDAGRSAAGSPSGTGRQGSAEGEALKADIQQLLHEMSGEIEQLQAQLSTIEQSQSQPTIGTSTDPELYEAPAKLEGAGTSTLPIHLQTDTAPIQSQRAGGGTGTPSGTVDSARPTAKAEEVQLADEPLEERAASRQVVPPEYRTVFDRLRKSSAEPN